MPTIFSLRFFNLYWATILLQMIVLPAYSQQTGEWIVVEQKIPGTITTIPYHVAAAAANDYVVAGQTNAFIGPFYLRHTLDGGATWKMIWEDSLSQESRIVELLHPTSNHFLALLDSITERIIEEPGKTTTYRSRRGVALGSANGGLSWFRTELENGRTFVACSMSDALHGAAIQHTIGQTTLADTILFTTDGGITWTMNPMPPQLQYSSSIVLIDSMDLRVVANNPQLKAIELYRSTDAGKTWERLTTFVETVRKIIFVTPEQGFALGATYDSTTKIYQSVVLRTDDSGHSWKNIFSMQTNPNNALSEIAFADAQHGIVTGRGKILCTSNGGEHWRTDLLPTKLNAQSSIVRDLAYPIASEAMVTATTEYVCKFTGRIRLLPPAIQPIRYSTSPTSITVKWSEIVGATLYDIQVGDTARNVTHDVFDNPYLATYGLTTTSHEIPVKLGTLYVIRVRSRNNHDTSDWSAQTTFRVLDTTVELAHPEWLYPTQGETGVQIPTTIRWQRVPGATSYLLMIDNLPTFSGSTTITQGDLRDTSYTFGGLRPNTLYYTRLRANNGTKTRWSSLLTFTTGEISSASPLSAPSAFTCRVVPNLLASGVEAMLVISSAEIEELQITIMDAAGRELQRLPKQRFDAGEHQLPLDASHLPAGTAFLVVEGKERRTVLPIWVF